MKKIEFSCGKQIIGKERSYEMLEVLFIENIRHYAKYL
jgi:hypothetical protein